MEIHRVSGPRDARRRREGTPAMALPAPPKAEASRPPANHRPPLARTRAPGMYTTGAPNPSEFQGFRGGGGQNPYEFIGRPTTGAPDP